MTKTLLKYGAVGALLFSLGTISAVAGAVARTAASGRLTQPVFALHPRISTLADQTPGNCTDPNVAAYFSMDETSGNLTVPTGCAASGTVFTANGTPTYSKQGPPGTNGAVQFGGTSDYFTTSGDVASLDITSGTQPFVIEFWARDQTGAGSGTRAIVSKQVANGTGWIVYQNSSGYKALVSDGTNSAVCDVTGGSYFNNTNWHYFRIYGTPRSFLCSADGSSSETAGTNASVGSIDNTGTTMIAKTNWTSVTSLFAGQIADLRITIGNSTNNLGYNDGLNAVTVPVVEKPGNCTDSNVAAYFSMDETSGNLTVPTGCAASGTVFTATGSPSYQTIVPSGLGKGITFTGSNYFTSTTDVDTLDLGTSSAVWEGWVNITSGSASGAIIGKYDGSNGWLLYLATGTTISVFVRGDGTNSCAPTGVSAVDGTWHYFRATWVNSTGVCTIAMDGGTANSQTTAAAIGDSITTTTAVEIGRRPDNATKITGAIADLRVTIGNSTNSTGFTAGPLFTSLAKTFTRATTSTRYNPSTGLVESVASGTPVVGAPEGGSAVGSRSAVGIYVGAATTFLILQNEAIDNAAWTLSLATVSADSVTAPDGNATADKLVDNGSGFHYARQSVTKAASAITYTATVFAKSTERRLCLDMDDGTGSNGASMTADLVGGQIGIAPATFGTGWSSASGSVTAFPNGFYRLTLTATSNTTTTIRLLTILDANTGTQSINQNYNATGYGVYVWRPEMYAKAFAVPLDPAVAATAVTVNQDRVGYAVAGAPGPDLMTTCAWINQPANGTQGAIVTKSGFAWAVLTNGGMQASPAGLSTWLVTTNANTYTRGSWGQVCIAMSQAASSIRVYSNAVEATYATRTQTWTAGASYGSNINVGWYLAGNEQWSEGFTSGVRIYPTALTAAQILALYNASSGTYALAPKPDGRVRQMLAFAESFLGAENAPIFRKLSNALIVKDAQDAVRRDPVLAAAWTMP